MNESSEFHTVHFHPLQLQKKTSQVTEYQGQGWRFRQIPQWLLVTPPWGWPTRRCRGEKSPPASLKGGSYISKISDTLLSSPNFRQLVPGNFLTLTRGGGAPGPISHDRNRAKTKPLGGFIAESLRFWRRFFRCHQQDTRKNRREKTSTRKGPDDSKWPFHPVVGGH